MSSRSLLDIDGSRELDAVCGRIARSSQCFDGHRQLPMSVTEKAPWDDGLVGFDPDQVQYEQSLEVRPGKSLVPSNDCVPGAECVCGSCLDPRTSLEIEEEKALVERIVKVWRREGRTDALILFIDYVVEEYGPGFRKRLINAGVIC